MTTAPAGGFDYDTHGHGYAVQRRTDPRIAALVHAALGEARTVVNIGAGAGGGEKYVDRHRARGRLPARGRIELLVDPDSAFLELSPLAGWGSDFPVGASVVTGIGVVEGVECVLVANDPTVRGGSSNPWTLRKTLRAADIAFENRLPLINLVESGGADLPTQKEIFIPGGRIFRDLTRLSAAGIPTIALVFGNSTAGGAYVPGMSDHVVMVKERAKVFLGGPPLVRMATGEESDDESLGGAEMHARVSGLADYLAADEHDALRIGRQIVRGLNRRKPGVSAGAAGDPLYDEDELLGIVPEDLKIPFDPPTLVSCSPGPARSRRSWGPPSSPECCPSSAGPRPRPGGRSTTRRATRRCAGWSRRRSRPSRCRSSCPAASTTTG